MNRQWSVTYRLWSFQPHFWPTNGTGDRLGMETPIQRIGVFFLTIGTHGKRSHGGFGAIVGDVFDDGKARSAVGAVDEGIAVATVGWVEEFAQAIGADADIRRDGLESALYRFRMEDVKGTEAVRGLERSAQFINAGKWRGFVTQCLDEGVQHIPFAIHFDVHPCGGVANPAVKLIATWQEHTQTGGNQLPAQCP